jgi:ABC-type dipeptide/oligopeptide/nickel transport system permease component
MSEQKRVFLLALIMAMATAVVVGITIFTLYGVAFEEERARLVETAQSQARMIEVRIIQAGQKKPLWLRSWTHMSITGNLGRRASLPWQSVKAIILCSC